MPPVDRHFLSEIETVLLSYDGQSFEIFISGMWIEGAFKRPMEMAAGDARGPVVYGNFRKTIGRIGFDANVPERFRLRLKEGDAAALRERDILVSDNRIVAWTALEPKPTLLFGIVR